ncbi:hypothetical protein LUZ62_014763 [Rhynchospora pubera]|uniref:Beta-1,3-glucanase n=1 Tax=Rhynchospora pubera TaxID=906938 RepID=A0AAV8GFY6_9POAL|nr:hypothetical protein LUZ62_014763 [Rhynchospora pubera]
MSMARRDAFSLVALALFILLAANPTSVESIGVCYGMLGNDLPSRSDVVKLYQTKGIRAMRIYAPDRDTFNALKGTGIELIVDVPKDLLPSLANDASAATNWVQNNILAYDGVSFKYIAVGNELMGNDANNILGAMSNIWDAICSAGRCGQIKVSTSVRFDVLTNTYPPSNTVFGASHMGPIVNFLKNTGNPLLVNVYPYFSYAGNQDQIRLDYALFTASGTVVTDGQYQYNNLFDAMVDSVYYALEKAGGSSVGVVVSESGWPSAGGAATTVDNARTYNQNLINHVRNGTPKRPGNLETYIFAMFNENQKTGDETERHFGLFYPNQTSVYSINFN